MSLYDDVSREALSDWLDVRRDLAADERPDPSEFDERQDEQRDDWLYEIEAPEGPRA